MTIRHLQIFKAVCETGSMTAAAERLNIAQPSVSVAIRELEVFYNAALFDRVNRGVSLTEAGALLRRYADEILDPFDEAASVLRGGKAFVKCRIGANVSIAEGCLGAFLDEIRRGAPDIELTLMIDNNERLSRMLAENRIDFALYDGLSDRKNDVVTPLFEEEQIALCAPSLFQGDRITVRALSDYPLLLREEGSGQRRCLETAFSQCGCAMKAAAVSVSTLSLIALAESGLGVAVVPRALAEKRMGSGLNAAVIEQPNIRRAYTLAHLRGKNLTPTMECAYRAIVAAAVRMKKTDDDRR